MKDYGLVSIITPNWNCSKYIVETIRSVQAQTYRNWEMIIMDDCSTDNSCSAIIPFVENDSRIRLMRNEMNSGAALSRNRALREAKGHWIAFLDSDDLWMPNKLERQLDFMVNNGYKFCYTNYCEIDGNSEETGIFISGPKRANWLSVYAFCWPGCLTVIYDRDTVGLVQIADIKKNNDYAMWLKVCKKADLHLFDECLSKYRRGRKGSISTHGYMTMIMWHYKLWHEAMNMNPLSSIFWTGMNLVFGVYKKLRYVKTIG